MNLDMQQVRDNIREMIHRPETKFMIAVHQDLYAVMFSTNRKDKAGTPYSRVKNRRLI